MSITTHMSGGFKSYAYPTYDEITLACNHITEFIHYNASGIGKVDTIVGLTRGGLMPAVELSHKMNIPMEAIQYSSKDGDGDSKNHANVLPKITGKSILIVDDICDSGRTLKELHEHYEGMGYKVFSAVIFFKDHRDSTLYTPDVWAIKISQNFGWIHFPFEVN